MITRSTAQLKMLTINEASQLIEGLTPFRIRAMCINGELPCIKAGRKYLIEQNTLISVITTSFTPIEPQTAGIRKIAVR